LYVAQPMPHHDDAVNPGLSSDFMMRAAYPQIDDTIADLRDVLDDRTYESLARRGEAMTTAAMATYAYGQIDPARTALSAISK
jgi:hypothetical protein